MQSDHAEQQWLLGNLSGIWEGAGVPVFGESPENDMLGFSWEDSHLQGKTPERSGRRKWRVVPSGREERRTDCSGRGEVAQEGLRHGARREEVGRQPGGGRAAMLSPERSRCFSQRHEALQLTR
ncbi:hypothetical protein SRHO_G00337110 [Serrasalmus rhombeus]